MGSRSGFDANLEFDEILVPVDRGSGVVSVATRQANVLTNLGFPSATVLSGITPGTALASKALVLGASKEIATITSATITTLTSTTVNATTVNATTHNAGADAVAGTLAVFPATTARGSTTITASDNTGATTTNINTAAQAGARTYTVPDAGGSASFVMSAGANTFTGTQTLRVGTATVSTAPLYFQSGINLTVAAVGATEFDGTCFYATALASSRQTIHTEQHIVLTAPHDLVDASIASATPLFVATGAATGAVTLAATTNYAFEGIYLVSNTGTTSHTWSTLFGGTVGITRINYMADGTTAAAGAATASLVTQSAAATATIVTAASTSATEFVTLRLRGNIVTSTAGTFIPQMLASARPGQTGVAGVTILSNSMFRIWPVGAAAGIVVGNWS